MAFSFNFFTSLFQRQGSQGAGTGSAEGTSTNQGFPVDEDQASNCTEELERQAAGEVAGTGPLPDGETKNTKDVESKDNRAHDVVRPSVTELEEQSAEADEEEDVDSLPDYDDHGSHASEEEDQPANSLWAGKWVAQRWRTKADAPTGESENQDKSNGSSLSGSTLFSVEDGAFWTVEDNTQLFYCPDPDCPVADEDTEFPDSSHLFEDSPTSETDEAIVRTGLVLARYAINAGRCLEGLHRALDALSKAKEVGLESLEAKCYFWKGIAEYNLGEYHAAYDSIRRAEQCRGLYVEGNWLDEYTCKIEEKLARSRRVSSGF